MCHCENTKALARSGFPTMADVNHAAFRLRPFIKRTPTELSTRLSKGEHQKVFLKREDLQQIRSFKVRGALNKMLCLTKSECKRGVVCASAGNHAQGFALACNLLKVKGVVFLPQNTPKQKIQQVAYFGKEWVELILTGENFNQAYEESVFFAEQNNAIYVHPFDDAQVIAGQATIALEMISDIPNQLDCLLVPVGGGGLASGLACVYKQLSPRTNIIGVEVEGSDAMALSLKNQQRVVLPAVDSFADGTAVQQVGRLPYTMCLQLLDDVIIVSKKDVCKALIDLNNNHGIIVEPSGVLTIAALAHGSVVKQQNVACIVSGGNNDAHRFVEYLDLMQL